MTTNILIPAAGLGNRFKIAGYTEDKPLIDVFGKPMIVNVINNFNSDNVKFILCLMKDKELNNKIQYELSKVCDNCEYVYVDEVTDGSACTCLLAEELIDNDDPLLIINCDQILNDWNAKTFFDFAETEQLDGIIGCFDSQDEKNSFARINENGLVLEVKEKKNIGKALNGIHYWKNGRLFLRSAKQMIEAEDRVNNEFYVAPSYNYMIADGLRIKTFDFAEHWPIGIPSDLELFLKNENIKF